MERKQFSGSVQLKGDGSGEVGVDFATLNVIDSQGDVTLPGAFSSGEQVRIASWGHGWDQLPVGRGTIAEIDGRAHMEGKFFLDTIAGKEHYLTVKNLGELQEWSYGYDVLEASYGKFQDRDVRFLKKLKVHEVSPVLLGAGVDTRTTDIKGRAEGETRERKPSGEVERVAARVRVELIDS
jgi:HK97 family phage prohead protease